MAATTTEEKPKTNVPVAKSIRLPSSKCRPSEATSRDETRPILTHAYLKQRDDGMWLLASDSVIAVAIKVETTGDVEEGYIPRRALRMMERGRYVVQTAPNAWEHVRGDGERRTWTVDLGPFPDLSKLFEGLLWDGSALPEVGADGGLVGFDPDLAHRATMALGGWSYEPVTAQWYGPVKAIRWSCATDRFALQMPIKLSER